MTTELDSGTDSLTAHLDDAGILRIVFDNPSSHNSLTAEMLAGVQRLFQLAASDDSVRAVLLRGAGQTAFASGADIGEQAQRAQAQARNPDRGDYLDGLLQCPKPVVAMIHGFCLGGGLMLAMAADIRVASRSASFSVPPARLGVAYPLSAVTALVEIVGPAWAADLMLTGERIDAEQAHTMGLITRVTSDEGLESETEDLLRVIVANAPLSLSVSKASIRHALAATRPSTAEMVARIDEVWASDDAREGMTAFFEKRPPRFRGC